MTNISLGRDATRLRRGVIAAVAVIVLAAVYGGWSIHTSRQRLNEFQDQLNCTWNGVPAVLSVAVNSPQYRDGGVYLANPSLLNNASDAQRDAYSYRLAIDFLRSLTPEQVNIMRSQALPFDRLSSDQKKALSQAAVSRAEGYVPTHVKESYIAVQSIGTRKGEPCFHFCWLTPGMKKGQIGIMFDIAFSATGDPKFAFPYRHL